MNQISKNRFSTLQPLQSPFKLLRLWFCNSLGRQTEMDMATDFIMTCTCKVSSKTKLFKVFNSGNEIYLMEQKLFGSHRGGLCHVFSHNQRKQTGAAALPVALVWMQHKNRKLREEEGSVTFSFPHIQVVGWFRSLCNQRTCLLQWIEWDKMDETERKESSRLKNKKASTLLYKVKKEV